jgi:hypothetical protein
VLSRRVERTLDPFTPRICLCEQIEDIVDAIGCPKTKPRFNEQIEARLAIQHRQYGIAPLSLEGYLFPSGRGIGAWRGERDDGAIDRAYGDAGAAIDAAGAVDLDDGSAIRRGRARDRFSRTNGNAASRAFAAKCREGVSRHVQISTL